MKKFEFPKDLNYRYKIQPPSGKNKKFRVIKFYLNPPPGTPKTETVLNSAVDAVNKALLSDKYPIKKAKEELDLLVEGLYLNAGVKKFMVVENSENIRLLSEFWNEYLESHRLKDKDSGYAKFRRAVEAIGTLSLKTASKREIQATLDQKVSGNKQRAVVGRLHTLLAWLKRTDIRLMLDDEEEGEVKYLTESELKAVLLNIDSDVFKLACQVARGTGMRIGEMMYFRRDQIKPDGKSVFIKYQSKRDGTRELAKSKRASDPGRVAYVLEEARELLIKWTMIKHEFTPEMRLNAANILRAACEKTFKHSPEKWLKFHDLRHSYAIELAQAGVSLLQISTQLGNSERVCQKHYTGYMATSESVDLIEAKIAEAKKLKC